MMENLNIIRSLVLRHQPYGEGHPYIPLPYERSPRDPAACEPVTLNIETEHNPSAKSVWCVWTTAGKKAENRVNAVLVSQGEGLDHWQVALPAFPGGETVHYRLFAENGNNKVESEEYSFSVLSWINVDCVTSIVELENKLDLKLSTDQDGLGLHLVIASDPMNVLSLSLTAIHEETSDRNSFPGPYIKEWDDLQLTLQNDPFGIKFLRKSDGMKIESMDPIKVLVDHKGNILQYRLGFASPSDEAFYGFGERFNALDQRGNHLDNYVYGQYTSQGKRTYIPIPFFISSRGYGLWLKTDRQAEFDLAAANPEQWFLDGHAEEDSSLDLKWFFNTRPLDIVQAFTGLTGKPKLPPSWVFGLWMSSNDWNSQNEVLKQLQETQKQQIPASVLVIEAWSDEINFYIWNDAQYRQKPSSQAYQLADFEFPPEGRWPDPKAMVDELHQNGLRLVLWQNPAIKYGEKREQLDETLNRADQAYAIEHGYVVLKADGTPHRVEKHMPWFGNSLVFDFTNPEAADWWFKKREYLVSELGVDGFKTDGGEHIWDTETRFYNGARGSNGINQYPVDYEAAYDHFMQSWRGRDFVLFSRAGYIGVQQYPCHWAGDENSTWDAFRATVRALLNAGLCGLPFVGWDIAGFAGPLPGSELYLRASAFSVFCPIMQYHSDVNGHRIPSRDRTPWNIEEQTGDTTVIATFRKFANLRMNLLPYILNQARLSSETGIPLMRSLSLVYPEDVCCRKFPSEYMFGEKLLVAPVVEEGVVTWPVYLPEGKWRDLWTGEIRSGSVEVEMDAPRDRIPVFQKEGSLLALNLDASGELCSFVGNSTDSYQHLALYIMPGGKFNTAIFLSLQAEPSIVGVESNTEFGTISITVPPMPQGLDLVVISGEPASIKINETPLPKLEINYHDASKSGWIWNDQKQEIRIHLFEMNQQQKITIQ